MTKPTDQTKPADQGAQQPADVRDVGPLDQLAKQVADMGVEVTVLAGLVKSCATLDALSAAHKRIDDLARHVDALRKGHDATTRIVADNLRDYTKVEPKNIHEAIQRLKAEGSTLVGFALRQAAGEKFLGWKPKPATAPAPARAATKRKA